LIFDTKTRMNNKFRLVINDHIVFYSGKGMKTSEHSNPAITIIISQSDHFEILSENKKTTSNFSILPANYNWIKVNIKLMNHYYLANPLQQLT